MDNLREKPVQTSENQKINKYIFNQAHVSTELIKANQLNANLVSIKRTGNIASKIFRPRKYYLMPFIIPTCKML